MFEPKRTALAKIERLWKIDVAPGFNPRDGKRARGAVERRQNCFGRHERVVPAGNNE